MSSASQVSQSAAPSFMPTPVHGPSMQCPPVPPRPAFLTKPPVSSMPLYQEVEVYLRTNVWAVGFVVATLNFFQKIAGWGYEIEYRSSSSRSGVERGLFPPEHVRPR